jgi:putative two-component system response regulator
MAIADVYDALIAYRPYKAPLSAAVAKDIILKGSGNHFDPALVELFEDLAPAFAEIAKNSNSVMESGTGSAATMAIA